MADPVCFAERTILERATYRGRASSKRAFAAAEGRNNLFEKGILKAMAESCGKSIGQVVLRWFVQRGAIARAETVRWKRMSGKFAIFDLEPAHDDGARISALETGTGRFISHRAPAIVKRVSGRKPDLWTTAHVGTGFESFIRPTRPRKC